MIKRISLILILTVSFLVVGITNADAMNNESAALLTAGIILLGLPVMNAIAHGGAYPEHSYSYPSPRRYIEKTKIIYVQPKYQKHDRHWAKSYDRGYRQEWKQLYRRGLRDRGHYYRRGRDDNH